MVTAALNRMGAEHRGPPIYGSGSNSCTFKPSEALTWAREQSLRPRVPRGRYKGRSRVVAMPTPVVERLPPAGPDWDQVEQAASESVGGAR